MVKRGYTKEKMNVSIDTKLVKKLEKIKKFPQWKGNRSSVVEAALESFLEKPNMISEKRINDAITKATLGKVNSYTNADFEGFVDGNILKKELGL